MRTPQSSRHLSLAVVFRPEPEGGFTVTVPSLPGCITYGKDLVEAERMARDAITLYLEDMMSEGEPFPQDTSSYLTQLEIALPSHRVALHSRDLPKGTLHEIVKQSNLLIDDV